MEFKFIAINGDNVGDSIGSAIATDNHEELSKITGGLKDAHGAIEQWIESIGGEVVTSSGDEGIYKIPAESYDEATIDSLREQYSQSTGTTITVGVGVSMSEASKALIYGKLNDKDQVVEYDPHIDDYIAGHDDEAMSDEGMEDPEMGDAQDPDGYTSQESMGDQEYEDESAEEMGNIVSDPEYQEEVPEMDETAVGGESAISETDEAMPEGEFDETLVQEGEMSEDDLDVAPEEKLGQVVGDLDGDGDVDVAPPTGEDESLLPEGGGREVADAQAEMPEMPEEGMEDPASMDPAMGDEAGMPIGEEAIPEEGMEAEAGMQGMVGDEQEAGDMGIDPETGEPLPDEGMEGDDQGALTDMIHANMGEEEVEPEADTEELRQDIATSLMTFKENKQMLEQAKTENPKLYEATILMLRSMIEMAKKLNMDPEADVEGQMAQDAVPEVEEDVEEGLGEELGEEDVDAEASEEAEAMEEVEDEAIDEGSQEKKDKNPFAKTEMVHLYSSLMKGTAVLERAEKQYWRKELNDKEARAKQTRRAKKIKGKKPKQMTDKKPVDQALQEVERKMKAKASKTKKEVTSKKKVVRKSLQKKDVKSLPDKSTKHIPKKQLPVGAVKNGKVKVKDGDTGNESWRSGRSGMARDWDGDAIATNYNKRDMKNSKTHTVHHGRKPKKDVHHAGESSNKEE